MKVCFIGLDRKLFDPESGVRKRVVEYGKLFDELHIIVLAKKDLGLKEEKISENIFLYPTNSINKFFYTPDAITIGKKINGLDVVSADGPESVLIARSISKKTGAKFHLQIHTDIFSKNYIDFSKGNCIRSFIMKKFLPKADGIRVVSERIKASILETVKTKADPVVLPIMMHTFKDGAEINMPFSRNILIVSRLEKEKNVDLAIDAFLRISKQYPEVGLIIAGDGSLRDALGQQVCNVGLKERVIFIGHVHNVADYYTSADIYMQTSSYEGYGMSLLEAALAGLPIVTTDIGIVGEVLVDGGSCLVARPDAADFADKLIKVLDDNILAKSLGGRAKEVAQAHSISQEAYLDAYKKVFEDICHSREGGNPECSGS